MVPVIILFKANNFGMRNGCNQGIWDRGRRGTELRRRVISPEADGGPRRRRGVQGNVYAA